MKRRLNNHISKVLLANLIHHSLILRSVLSTENSLEKSLQQYSDDGFLTRKSLEEGAKAIDINFNFAQLEYIVTQLFEVSNDVNMLPLEALFQIFRADLIDESFNKESTGHAIGGSPKSPSNKRPGAGKTLRSGDDLKSIGSGKGKDSKAGNNNVEDKYQRELDEALLDEDNDPELSFDVENHKMQLEAQKAHRPSSKGQIKGDEKTGDDEPLKDNKDSIKTEIQQLLDDDDDDEEGQDEYLFPGKRSAA